MSFSSDSRALSVPYVLNRLVRTLADNVKYNAPPSPSSSNRQDDNASPDADNMSGNGDPSKSSAWANKFKLWGKKTDGYEHPAELAPEPITDAPEAEAIALRIQALVDSLPTPGTKPDKRISKPPKPIPPTRDSKGRCIPPPGSTPIKDNKLIALLSSPPVMNGEEEGRSSVWSVLETIHHRTHPPKGDDGGEGGDEDEEEDDRSLMLYAPLVPTKDSKLEVAATATLLPEGAATTEGGGPPPAGWWPWGPSKKPAPGKKVRVKGKKVWVPSTTSLSVQTMWWGYKLYLPPPVLDILNDRQLEATKRAAMITTALKWIVDNIPTAMIPLPLQPALLVIQRIVPFIGYIGGFIAWSWSTIKSYDEGLGVILTATWILPVALIPGTWRASDVPSAEPDPPASDPPASEPTPTDPPPTTTPAANAKSKTKARR
ncbi:hypothetical protein PC9H_003995 [Pleurotus ostreatus]|uniref:Uncharacterized protein n=1 Tax=Pleurotus ostreatus TaxID=5322 RepID=A0A8H7A2H0_PLEOS|nr:uncharacterized protein PC9H_003995 [Pleurotus ostreatus]KAF7437159.1 hypothetical protein PC9H_003995 [Pleurotus ostreatus]KAJ8703029.1 hypothetical protein PTI98_001688 [Pleurotus ostreatus]